jgi:hypothetical protein
VSAGHGQRGAAKRKKRSREEATGRGQVTGKHKSRTNDKQKTKKHA